MAKLRNLVMRGATKQVGGMVTYQRAGETIARELAASVKNPRTNKQMLQRTKLANLVNFYRANKAWMKNAFENKQAGLSDYNRLVSLNVESNSIRLTKTQANFGVCIADTYMVSAGSLPSIKYAEQSGTIMVDLEFANAGSTLTTVGQLSTGLISKGWQNGDQLSIIVMNQIEGLSVDEPRLDVKAFEVKLDSSSSELLSAYFPQAYISFGVGSGNKANAEIDGGVEVFGVVAIHSRSIAGKTYVSTQQVMLSSDDYITMFNTDEQAEMAIKSYGESKEVFLDSDVAHKA